ncbi:MAG TPA: (2Fe-2S)-binding protein [Solirubrobacterales bacterium]|nr:(2Fe-2S)-binding protein [Solirubrobacterales bacterium]
MRAFRKSEIDATLSRIAMANADGYGILVRRRKGPGDGWFPAADLGEDGPAPAVLLANVRGLTEPPPDHIRAEWLLESLARAVADLGGSFLVSARRLPDLSPANVLLAAEGGLIRATGVVSERLTVLEGDPATGRDDVTDAARWEELADLFRIGYIDLLAPLVRWLDGQGLRPAKTLWHAAADRLAQSLVWSGKAFDQREFAREVTERVVGGDPRLEIPLETDEDEYGDRYHLRATCCLAYRTPEGGLCRACPLQKKA